MTSKLQVPQFEQSTSRRGESRAQLPDMSGGDTEQPEPRRTARPAAAAAGPAHAASARPAPASASAPAAAYAS